LGIGMSRMWSFAATGMALVAGSVVLNVVSTDLFHDIDPRDPAASSSLSPATSTMWVALGLAVVAGIVAIGLAIAGIRRMAGDESVAFPMVVAGACVLAPLAAAALVCCVNLATDDRIRALLANT
jgi:hypothetical protein